MKVLRNSDFPPSALPCTHVGIAISTRAQNLSGKSSRTPRGSHLLSQAPSEVSFPGIAIGFW